MSDLKYKPVEAILKLPLDSATSSGIAYKVLSVDKEPQRNFVQKELSLHGEQLHACFHADNPKKLRSAITSFFEAFFLVTNTIDEFGSKEVEETKNDGTHSGPNSG